MGSSIPDDGGFDDLPDADPIEEPSDDKPFDDEPFEAGVEADEENEPEKYIQQLSGKLGQSLRKYTEELGAPDYDLEKFAINSVLSATNSGEMDQQDQSDIIQKVKSSTTDGTSKKDEEPEPNDTENTDNEDLPDDEPLDLDNIDMEESVLTKKKSRNDLLDKEVYVSNRKEKGIVKKVNGDDILVQMPDRNGKEGDMINVRLADVKETHNPNGNNKTVFEDPHLGVDDEGMEENKYSPLKEKIKEIVEENFMNLNFEPLIQPKVKSEESSKPKRETRRAKPWRVVREDLPKSNDEENEDNDDIKVIDTSEYSYEDDSITITFDVNGVRFVENFVNSGEIVEKPSTYKEPWVYLFKTDILENDKQYYVEVAFLGNPETNLDFVGFEDLESNGPVNNEVPNVKEV